ncbi:hypothetical protein C0991_001626 [Blastosporella zonata]|nr:hypothetical protein C0991_001626 [Blastosporella zonata]
MLLPGNSILRPHTGTGISRWILPTVMRYDTPLTPSSVINKLHSLPYLVRFRQCVIEYNHQANTHRRPLYNALKYASAFPAIYLSAAQGFVVGEVGSNDNASVKTWYGGNYIFGLWLLAALVNSLYSFWWDVTNDWGMDILRIRKVDDHGVRLPSGPPRRLALPRMHSATPLISTPDESLEPQDKEELSRSLAELSNHKRYYHPFGLRHSLHFPLLVYPFLIFLNLVLRLTWSMKLFSVVNVSSHAGIANFCLKMAELFRRWMWVFIRVEWEMIKKGRESHMKLRTDDEAAEYEMIPSATIERI